MYHYFPDKNELVQAVIEYQAETIVKRNAHALASANGVEAWRKMVITAARRTQARGGCQLGSLGGQLAESDPEARVLIAAGFDQWAAAISDGLRPLHTEGKFPSDIDPDDLADACVKPPRSGHPIPPRHGAQKVLPYGADERAGSGTQEYLPVEAGNSRLVQRCRLTRRPDPRHVDIIFGTASAPGCCRHLRRVTIQNHETRIRFPGSRRARPSVATRLAAGALGWRLIPVRATLARVTGR